MIGFGRVHAWFAVTISAALIGAAGSAVYDGSSVLAGRAPMSDFAHTEIRAQADDLPDIEQVGEGETEDQEALDEGAPPAQDGDDVELLDQGAPPATAAAPPADTATAPLATAAAPVADSATVAPVDSGAVYTAPAPAATGPVLPPGFGSGRVRASAGRFGFPVGLENCHVGAVTGRAYVGIDCGEDGEGDSDVVGHAPSFEDFPFVLEAEFPFESDDAFFSDPFFTGGDSADVDGDDVEASTRRATRGNSDNNSESSDDTSENSNDSNTSENVVVTGIGTGNAAAELAQRERDRGPRVRTGKEQTQSAQKSNRQRAGNGNASAASADKDSNSNGQAKHRGKSKSKNKKQHAAKADNGNKGKKSKDGKKKREKRRSGKKN
jgi:hypothetical protein